MMAFLFSGAWRDRIRANRCVRGRVRVPRAGAHEKFCPINGAQAWYNFVSPA
jgi:hypothetical protein